MEWGDGGHVLTTGLEQTNPLAILSLVPTLVAATAVGSASTATGPALASASAVVDSTQGPISKKGLKGGNCG